MKIEQDISNEFVLVLDEGDGVPDGGLHERREKAAYYKSVERKIVLKKKRANRWDTYADKWDAINLRLGPFGAEEAAEREEALAEVVDPGYVLQLQARGEGDGDADGDGEEEGLPGRSGDMSMES